MKNPSKLSVLSLVFLAGFFSTVSLWADEISQKKAYKGIPTSFSKAREARSSESRSYTQEDLPSVLVSGFSAYQSQNSLAAITAWVKGGPNEGDVNVLANLSKAFEQIESLYGKYTGYDVVLVNDISVSTKQIFIQINYEKGPVFSRFLCYRAGSGWVVVGRIVIATDPEKVFES